MAPERIELQLKMVLTHPNTVSNCSILTYNDISPATLSLTVCVCTRVYVCVMCVCMRVYVCVADW